MPDASNANSLVHRMEIRVRYQETDAQGHVHHSNYLNYFEAARTEMLRSWGRSYRDLEDSGTALVIVHAETNYHAPARFDDVLTVETQLVRAKGVRLKHQYTITRDDQTICHGHTIAACVDPSGKPKRLPDFLQLSIKATT